MTSRSGREDIARRTFDLVAAIDRCGTLVALDNLFTTATSALGFGGYVLCELVDVAGRVRVGPLAGRSAIFLDGASGLTGHDLDHLARLLLSIGDPLYWSELALRPPLDQGARAAARIGLAAGFDEAFLTPIRRFDKASAAVILMGASIDTQDSDLRTAAHLISLSYGSASQRLRDQLAREASVAAPLSARQRECLQWVRAGKSSEDIGELLGISADTVNHHIAVACRKLGVRTRVQAVAEAAVLGFVEL